MLIIAGLVVVAAVPKFIESQKESRTTLCIANLRTIESAKQQWAADKKKTVDDEPRATDLFGPSSYVKSTPVCPSGGVYKLKKVKDRPTCSIEGHVY